MTVAKGIDLPHISLPNFRFRCLPTCSTVAIDIATDTENITPLPWKALLYPKPAPCPLPQLTLWQCNNIFQTFHTYKNNKPNKQNPSEYPFTCLSFLTLLSWFCIQNKIKLFLFLIFFYQCLCLDLRHYHPLLLRTNALAFPLGSQLFLSFYIPP